MLCILRLKSFEYHKMPTIYKIWFQFHSPTYCLPSRVFGPLSLAGNNLIIDWHYSKLSQRLSLIFVKFSAAPLFTPLLFRWIPPNLSLNFVEKTNKKQTNTQFWAKSLLYVHLVNTILNYAPLIWLWCVFLYQMLKRLFKWYESFGCSKSANLGIFLPESCKKCA